MIVYDRFVKEIIQKRKLTFEKLTNEWLKYKKNMIKESTYCHYMQIIEKYLIPQFKNINFKKTIDYNEFIQELSEKLSPKSVRDIITILRSILNYYEEEYEKVLKVKRSTIPKPERQTLKVLTKPEKRNIEKYCLENDALINIGILLCLNTGMRVGEVCALRWSDIDMEEKKIYIKKTVERVYDKKKRQSKIIIDTPKTQASIRSIPMSIKVYDIIKPLRKKYSHDDFLLSGTQKCVEPRNCQYAFKEMLKKLKLKNHKFHILRHSFATECLEVGMDVKSLSEILGHSDVAVTLKVYVHSSDKLKKKFLNKL